jgi:hypothetical protein
MDENKIFKKVTNNEIYEEIQKQHATLEQVLAEARRTNGRITRLEQVGIGMWIRNNPFKFAAGCILFVMIFISDFRHPIMELIKTLIF